MKTKPRGIHATFETDCHKCGDEITVTSGKVDRHECLTRTFPLTVWADPEEVSGWQEIRKEILGRLETALDNR